MTTTTTDATEAALDTARRDRDTAEQALQALRDRLAQGDTTVTADQLVHGAANANRLELLAQAAERRHAEAVEAARLAAITGLFDRAEGDPGGAAQLLQLRDAAQEAIAALYAAARTYNSGVADVVRELRGQLAGDPAAEVVTGSVAAPSLESVTWRSRGARVDHNRAENLVGHAIGRGLLAINGYADHHGHEALVGASRALDMGPDAHEPIIAELTARAEHAGRPSRFGRRKSA